MPDGQGGRSEPQAGSGVGAKPVGGIVRDPIDVRDRSYEPSLAPLPRAYLPSERLLDELRNERNLWRLPRHQGDEGSCGGQALAALIDIERIHADIAEPYPASARMIQEMARIKGGSSGVSLRDVIKSFYNYGVCGDATWPYRATHRPEERGALDVARAREARQISLGAYYRLRPNLNTYHAALHETGALLVSAELHDGWLPERVAAARGRILPSPPGRRGTLGSECHAFVVVGYTHEGFLVLNSWGRDWGGWAAAEGADPAAGIALWCYEDWADSIVDGWVLRLGVGAADAFEYSIGDQGLGWGADSHVRTTPVHAILGNFLHLDDGEYVGEGAYLSTQRTLNETRALLEEKLAGGRPYRGVLLTFAGALFGLKEAAASIARQKKLACDLGWYPFTVLWSVDYVDQAKSVLAGVFREAQEQAGSAGAELDRIIESRAHGVGRAFWREIRRAANWGVRPSGPMHDLVRAAAALGRRAPGFGIRVVAESEGAFALTALAGALLTEHYADDAEAIFDMLHSVDLIAPPMTDGEFAALALYLNAGWGRRRPDRRLFVHLPTAADERRLAVTPYGRSYFELVRRAFQPRDEQSAADVRIEMGRRAPRIVAAKWDPWRDAPRTTLVPIAWPTAGVGDGGNGERRPPEARGPISQLELLAGSDVGGRLARILRRRPPRPIPPG